MGGEFLFSMPSDAHILQVNLDSTLVRAATRSIFRHSQSA
jgi:hypothetical protein